MQMQMSMMPIINHETPCSLHLLPLPNNKWEVL